MTPVTIQAELNGIQVPLTLDPEALALIAAALAEQQHGREPAASPLLTIAEAATHLRCKRQRIDDLLSQRRLTRIKEGRRTLIRRDEIEQHLRDRGSAAGP
jgi:excisionase family DNA binding protein